MRSLRKRIQILKQRAFALADILKGLPNLECPGNYDVTGEGLTKQWIAYELAVTLGLLDEAVLTYCTIWPQEEEWSTAQSQLVHNSLDPLLPHLKEDIHAEAMVHRDEIVGIENANLVSDKLFEIIATMHELINAETVAKLDSSIIGPIYVRILFIHDAIPNLDADTRRRLRSMTSSYLSDLWIYPWIYKKDPNSFRYQYSFLFSCARFIPQELTMNLFEGFSSILRSIANNKEIHVTIQHALEHVAELIAQDGLDGLFDILSANGSVFGGVNPNAKSLINVIPGSGDDQCRPILFAFAKTGGGKSRFSTPAIMRRVREHLIHCQNRVMVVILIAPLDGLSDSLEDSIGDIEAHMNNGKGPLQLFIPLAVFKNKMSLINWQ